MISNAQKIQSAVSYPRRFLRLPQVEEITGFKRSHIYNLMKAGLFPTSVKLGLRAVAWDSHAIEHWQKERLAAAQMRSN